MNKNNLLLYVIIILSILLIIYGYFVFFFNKNEPFQVIFPITRHSCNFYPWGPNEESCKSYCLSNHRVGLWDIDGNQCNDQICEELCSSCRNETDCQWIANWDQNTRERLLGQEDTSVINELVPRQLQISGISYLDTGNLELTDSGSNIKINWNNYGDADYFMIHFYNMRNQNNMIKIETINDNTKEEHILSGLEQSTQYAIIVYAINNYGISKGSNIIEVNT